MTEQELYDTGDHPATIVDPIESAKVAGLRYISADTPGIRRERQGDAFRCERSHLGYRITRVNNRWR